MKASLYFEITEKFRDEMLERAKKEHITMEALTRKALRKYLGISYRKKINEKEIV